MLVKSLWKIFSANSVDKKYTVLGAYLPQQVPKSEKRTCFSKIMCYHKVAYEECARDKPVDRTATCRKGKVLKLDRLVIKIFEHLSETMGAFLYGRAPGRKNGGAENAKISFF